MSAIALHFMLMKKIPQITDTIFLDRYMWDPFLSEVINISNKRKYYKKQMHTMRGMYVIFNFACIFRVNALLFNITNAVVGVILCNVSTDCIYMMICIYMICIYMRYMYIHEEKKHEKYKMWKRFSSWNVSSIDRTILKLSEYKHESFVSNKQQRDNEE